MKMKNGVDFKAKLFASKNHTSTTVESVHSEVSQLIECWSNLWYGLRYFTFCMNHFIFEIWLTTLPSFQPSTITVCHSKWFSSKMWNFIDVIFCRIFHFNSLNLFLSFVWIDAAKPIYIEMLINVFMNLNLILLMATKNYADI